MKFEEVSAKEECLEHEHRPQIRPAEIQPTEAQPTEVSTTETSPTEQHPAPIKAKKNELLILVAEDNPTNQMIIKKMLEGFGMSLVLVENGEKALAAYEAGLQNNQAFDLILMDMHMPVLDGLGAIQALQAKYPDFQTPILACTADIMPETIASLRASKISGIICKPYSKQQLFKSIEEALL